MKKRFLIFTLLSLFLVSGCTVDYTTIITPSDDDPSETEEDPKEDPLPSSIEIDESLFFYPTTLEVTDEKITSYTYIYDKYLGDAETPATYKIYSAYYSEYYDTIYIAYDSVTNPVQTLKAKDLHEIEMHAINYFVSDDNRSEDKNYLKAVRIYPDRVSSACRRTIDNDNDANNINGCADYGGQEAIINLNNTTSLDDFYKPKSIPNGYHTYIYEPMRDTFAHEYGHVSTFYHMAYKNDGDYEDYLKLRLSSLYDTIYPSGLPLVYSSDDDYTIQPEEILADDFVELFYDVSNKKADDAYEYDLNYDEISVRNSLHSYPTLKTLKDNVSLFNEVKDFYTSNFLNYDNKVTYDKPIVISSSNRNINYYESSSTIGDITNLKTITSPFDVKLIAIGEATIDGVKYYRVILSNTVTLTSDNKYNQKDVGKMCGYVQASSYIINSNIKVYKVDKMNKDSVLPVNATSRRYFLPFYDFSYVINITNSTNVATMYDYFATEIASRTYDINVSAYGTLIQ